MRFPTEMPTSVATNAWAAIDTIVAGIGKPLVPIGNPIASSPIEIPNPASIAAPSDENETFFVSSSPPITSLRTQSATMMSTRPPRSRQRHHGLEERANTSAGRSGFTVRKPRAMATAKVSSPSGNTKAAIFTTIGCGRPRANDEALACTPPMLTGARRFAEERM